MFQILNSSIQPMWTFNHQRQRKNLKILKSHCSQSFYNKLCMRSRYQKFLSVESCHEQHGQKSHANQAPSSPVIWLLAIWVDVRDAKALRGEKRRKFTKYWLKPLTFRLRKRHSIKCRSSMSVRKLLFNKTRSRQSKIDR